MLSVTCHEISAHSDIFLFPSPMDPTGPPAEGDVNLGLGIIASVAVTTTACIFTVVLRFWVRGRLVKAIGWDDWTILLALVRSLS